MRTLYEVSGYRFSIVTEVCRKVLRSGLSATKEVFSVVLSGLNVTKDPQVSQETLYHVSMLPPLSKGGLQLSVAVVA